MLPSNQATITCRGPEDSSDSWVETNNPNSLIRAFTAVHEHKQGYAPTQTRWQKPKDYSKTKASSHAGEGSDGNYFHGYKLQVFTSLGNSGFQLPFIAGLIICAKDVVFSPVCTFLFVCHQDYSKLVSGFPLTWWKDES